MEFIPYCAEEAFQFCFYQIPKELFTNDYYKGNLSSDAILLYALLLDRLSISRKRGWIDENGHIYLIFTRKNAEEMLNISDKTATKAFRQLKELKLINEKRLGKGKTYRIYVGKINRKKSDSSTGNFTTDLSEKVRNSKNNNSYNKNSSNKYARSSKYLDSVRTDIDYAISQARVYNDFTKILTKMGYELEHSSNKMSIRKPPYKRYVRVERTFGEEYSKESILFRIKHTVSFKVPFPEVHTLIGRYKRKNKTAIRHKQKAKGLRALYLHYCYLLKVFPKQKYSPKYSKAMKEEIKKMDDYSNSARFLAKHNITTLTEIKEYKSSAINKIVELKGLRENLWRKHKRIKTFEEGQFICSEIQKLATKIDELNKDIKLCDFIENNTLKMKNNISEMRQEENNNVKVKNRNRDVR